MKNHYHHHYLREIQIQKLKSVYLTTKQKSCHNLLLLFLKKFVFFFKNVKNEIENEKFFNKRKFWWNKQNKIMNSFQLKFYWVPVNNILETIMARKTAKNHILYSVVQLKHYHYYYMKPSNNRYVNKTEFWDEKKKIHHHHYDDGIL